MHSIAIHQPEFIPWIGFFNKMLMADTYVILEHVQFKKRYFENRNRIVNPKGEVFWVGVPVLSKGRYTQSIADVVIAKDERWIKKFIERIRHAYAKSPYFERYFPDLEHTVASRPYSKLADLNLALINFLRSHLKIETPMLFSSNLGLDSSKGSDLILSICLKTGASRYLSGANGKDYLDEKNFARKGVEIEYLNYVPPSYPQLCPNHVSHLSSLDLLFNTGPFAAEIVAQSSGGRS